MLSGGREWIGECRDGYGHIKVELRILDGQPDQVKVDANGYNGIFPVKKDGNKWEYYKPKYFIDEMLTILYNRYIDDLITGDADGIPK